VVPHSPQLFGSLERVTQWLPQVTVPGGHVQRSCAQISSVEQAMSHPPQCIGSLAAVGTPLHERQSSIFPSQSLSRPSPQSSSVASGTHAQTLPLKFVPSTHPQFAAAGQSESAAHDLLQIPPRPPLRTQSPLAQSSVFVHGAPNSPGPNAPGRALHPRTTTSASSTDHRRCAMVQFPRVSVQPGFKVHV
jgi:hypothetical protein